MASQTQVELLLRSIDEAYERKTWHGPNLRGSIRGLRAEQAAWRPAPKRHNIWEIVVHAAYWKYAVRRRLTGEKRGSFALPGSDWFARPESPDEKAWRSDIALLQEEHRRLRETVADFSDKQLETLSGKTTVLDTVRGIAFHDVYHAGQIQLLKRLQPVRSLVLFLILLLSGSHIASAEARTEPDVTYGMYSGLALLMDVYHPENPNGYGVIYVSGSGWHAPLAYDARPLKASDQVELYARRLVEAGYTVFAVNHRAAPRFRYPAAVEDVQRAVRFVRHHAGKYGIDPYHIGATGGSSGGHLVSMLGVLDGDGDADDPDPVNRESAKVQSVVARAAPSDLSRIGTQAGSSAVASFMGLRFRNSPDSEEYKTYWEASPANHVSRDDAPFLLLHGDADETVPFDQSPRMEQALNNAGIEAKLLRISGGSHGATFGNVQNPPDYMGEMIRWLDGHLRHQDVSLVYPGETWERRTPQEAGLSSQKLEELSRLVGGQGCVVRNGYLVYTWGDFSKSRDVASAVKPVISHLLLTAAQEGRLASVDEPLSDVDSRLATLNGGKDAGITWRHLASQTSGYGLAEKPGDAWAYNDYALALYYETLTQKVFREDGTRLLKARLADVLGFEDSFTFQAFGPEDRPGRLAISPRDFARFGLLYLRGGQWKGRQVLQPELIRMALSSLVPVEMPQASGREADMLPDQRSLGGGKTITAVGPGYYSFNWWLNGLDAQGRRLYLDAPPDTFVASGHGGRRTLWVIPSLDLIVSWNDSSIRDHDATPGNPDSLNNQAARLMTESVLPPAPTRVSIRDTQWYINNQITYPGSPAEGLLINIRMVNSTFEDRRRDDFNPELNTNAFIRHISDYARFGVRAFTLNLQGGMPGYEGALNTAFNGDGSLRDSYLQRIRRVIEVSDRSGIAVILGCFYQRQDQHLQDEEAVRRAVVNTVNWIRENSFTNVVLEISNEYDHRGFDHPILKSEDGQVELIQLAKRTYPDLLVSTSGLGHGRMSAKIAEAADFILIHFNGTPVEEIAGRIEALKRFGKPIVCNEDNKVGRQGALAAIQSLQNGASWGYMNNRVNQYEPFVFSGHRDDAIVYDTLKSFTTPALEVTAEKQW